MNTDLIRYRQLKVDETDFLRDMLYEALYVPEGEPHFPKSILDEPALSKYYTDWGKDDFDSAIVSEVNDERIGLIWGRCYKSPHGGYGYVDDETPELSMAVKERFRNQGVGSTLIQKIEAFYCKQNIQKLSLSVDKRNKALTFYKRNGFKIYSEFETSVTCLKSIKLS